MVKGTQFKTQLQSAKKGPLSMNEYLLKIKNFVDSLALVSHFVSTFDYIRYLNGVLQEVFMEQLEELLGPRCFL